MRPSQRWRDERGTVLVLAVAGMVLVVAVVLVLSDVSALFMRRAALMMAADDAALAAASAIDVGSLYETGVGGSLALDPVDAQVRAQASVDSLADARLSDVQLERVTCDGDVVTVTLSARVPNPLAGVTGTRQVRIRVRASALAPTRF